MPLSLRVRALLFGVLSGMLSSQAQELVVNGGLEAGGRCPEGPTLNKFKVGGVAAAQGHPDLYRTCSEAFGVPPNWSGHQAAWEGSGYAGLILTTDGTDECGQREYLQFPLNAPLENGRRYTVSFQVSAAEHAGYFTDRIGALLTHEDHARKGLPPRLRERADVEQPLGDLLNDTTGWTTVTGIYTARGDERFLLVGNFHPCNRSTRVRIHGDKASSMKLKGHVRMDPDRARGGWREWLLRTAYAYVDGVSVQADTSQAARFTVLDAAVACREALPPSGAPQLVPDPRFDRQRTGETPRWSNASGGTPDLFDGQVGLYLHSAVNRDNREYIRTPLTQQLDPCATYQVRMDVRRSTEYAYAVDAIGIAVVDTFHTGAGRDRMDLPWAWRSPLDQVMTSEHSMTLCGTFRTPVCARQLVLGNFGPDAETRVVTMGSGGPFAYYFVDDVQLWEVDREPGCIDPCPWTVATTADAAGLPTGPPAQAIFRFESDAHEPSEGDRADLEAWVRWLERSPTVQLLVVGHTDGSGSVGHNERLALARATHVRVLLIALGAAPERVLLRSAAAREPLADDRTEEGRALNRRVEVRAVE